MFILHHQIEMISEVMWTEREIFAIVCTEIVLTLFLIYGGIDSIVTQQSAVVIFYPSHNIYVSACVFNFNTARVRFLLKLLLLLLSTAIAQYVSLHW
jgi:hypothetical protein